MLKNKSERDPSFQRVSVEDEIKFTEWSLYAECVKLTEMRKNIVCHVILNTFSVCRSYHKKTNNIQLNSDCKAGPICQLEWKYMYLLPIRRLCRLDLIDALSKTPVIWHSHIF